MGKNEYLIGIVTHKRDIYLENLLRSIKNCSEGQLIFVYKDGKEYDYTMNRHLSELLQGTQYIEGESNNGVGYAKKQILDRFKHSEYEHLFIIEDDVLIKDCGVFDYCIEFSKTTGLLHFNWNDCNKDLQHIRFEVQYDKDDYMTALVNRDCSGVFQYFHKSSLDYFEIDLNYKNAWEHIDIELQLCMQGKNPPFWSFVSPKNLSKMLSMQDKGDNSSILGRPDQEENLRNGYEYFRKKWGFVVNQIPLTDQKMVSQYLFNIFNHKFGD